MSIRVMNVVWSDAPYGGGALIVLLALADWADDSGRCFPKVPTIAKKSRLTERQVRSILRGFTKHGTLSVETGGGRGISNRYRINPEKFSRKSLSVKSEAETLKSATKNDEICDIDESGSTHVESTLCGETRRGNRHYPSIEPSSISSEPGGSDANIPVVATTRTADLDESILVVWKYYIDKIGRNPKTYSFTPLRKRKSVARLHECLKKTEGDLGGAIELMKVAIDALAASDFHMGRDAKTNGKKYYEWEDHLFKSYEQMEKWWNQ